MTVIKKTKGRPEGIYKAKTNLLFKINQKQNSFWACANINTSPGTYYAIAILMLLLWNGNLEICWWEAKLPRDFKCLNFLHGLKASLVKEKINQIMECKIEIKNTYRSWSKQTVVCRGTSFICLCLRKSSCTWMNYSDNWHSAHLVPGLFSILTIFDGYHSKVNYIVLGLIKQEELSKM